MHHEARLRTITEAMSIALDHEDRDYLYTTIVNMRSRRVFRAISGSHDASQLGGPQIVSVVIAAALHNIGLSPTKIMIVLSKLANKGVNQIYRVFVDGSPVTLVVEGDRVEVLTDPRSGRKPLLAEIRLPLQTLLTRVFQAVERESARKLSERLANDDLVATRGRERAAAKAARAAQLVEKEREREEAQAETERRRQLDDEIIGAIEADKFARENN